MDPIVEHFQGQVDTLGFHLESHRNFEGFLNSNMTGEMLEQDYE